MNGSSQFKMLPPRGLTSDNDQSLDVECTGSQDANDAITDIEHWHCENCGGLPRHMHPRTRAAKRARVSFAPVLPTHMATTSAQAVPTTHPSGGWPIRTAMPLPAKGKGKEAMEDPVDPEPIQDVTQPDGMIDPARRQRGKRKHTGHYRKSGARAPNENTF